MDSDTIALLGGLLFLLLALVGGGFSIKEISMPTIPTMARAACLVVGVVLVVLSFAATPGDESVPSAEGPTTDEPATTTAPGAAEPQAPSGDVELDTNAGTVLDPEDRMEVSGLTATGPLEPVPVDDFIKVSYTLTNRGSTPVSFVEVFTGTEPPEGVDEGPFDAGHDHQGIVLAPGESLPVEHQVHLYGAGTWTIWPCYELENPADEANNCPDTWNHFFVKVG